ncbi:MAG TPA: AAA family ATPase [Gemmataceae bacterium]|nr:AAA family ATPase [Gemmataceae bacterium]
MESLTLHIDKLRGGQARVSVRLGGRLIFVDILNPASANERAACIAALIRRYPALGTTADTIDEQLLVASVDSTPASSATAGPAVECFANIRPESIDWLWQNRIPVGRLTLIAGRPGEGKSFLTLDMASRVSTGTPWPDGATCQSGGVLLLCQEDDPADTVRPRLDAHLADVSRIHLLRGSRTQGGVQPIALADVDIIEGAIEQIPGCRLVVVDPLGSYLGGRVDMHKDNEVRFVLAPLAALARRHRVAVVIVVHARKAPATHADDGVLGSRGFVGVARAVWHVVRDPENRRRRLFLPGKNNLAEATTGLAFSISCSPPRVIWEPEPISRTADEVAAASANAGRPAAAFAEKIAFLRGLLADGPRPAAEVQQKWQQAGLGSSKTLYRAKEAAGITSDRSGSAGGWRWRLPDPPPPRSPDGGGEVSDDHMDTKMDSVHLGVHLGKSEESQGLTSTFSKMDSSPREGVHLESDHLGGDAPTPSGWSDWVCPNEPPPTC